MEDVFKLTLRTLDKSRQAEVTLLSDYTVCWSALPRGSMTVQAETQKFSLEFDLAHPLEKVRRSLTEPKLVAEWIMANDVKPKVGHSFRFTTTPSEWWDGIVNSEVLEVDMHKRLSYTWNSGPAASPLNTVVTWTLTATPSGTRLTIEQSGFLPGNAHAFGGAKAGWRSKVNEGLVAVLANL